MSGPIYTSGMEKTMETLEFYLKGKGSGSCDLADLGAFCVQLNEALKHAHRAKEPGTGKLPKYELTDVEIASFRGFLHAGASGALAIATLVSSLGAIRSGEKLPVPVTSDDIRTFRKLAEPLGSNTEAIIVGNVPIDMKFVAQCDALLAASPKSLGQATGRLEAVSTHSASQFRLYPFNSDRGIVCYFDEQFYDDVIANMRKRVRVSGLVHRNPDGIGIDRVTNITKIEKVPENNELPTLASLFGRFADRPIDVAGGWE